MVPDHHSADKHTLLSWRDSTFALSFSLINMRPVCGSEWFELGEVNQQWSGYWRWRGECQGSPWITRVGGTLLVNHAPCHLASSQDPPHIDMTQLTSWLFTIRSIPFFHKSIMLWSIARCGLLNYTILITGCFNNFNQNSSHSIGHSKLLAQSYCTACAQVLHEGYILH